MPEGTFHMGKRLDSLEELSNGRFNMKFEDGQQFEADAVIGADGIKSKLRQILLGKDNPESYPKYSGEFGYRSLVPMEDAIAVLGEEFARNGNVNIADGALTTSYPVEKGSMLNIVAARDQEKWEDESWILPADKKTVEEEFKGCGKRMRQVVSLLKDPQKWSLWHHPTASTFYRGNLAIIGDAAHAATPHQGAGAGQAFEDALVLTHLFADPSVQEVGDIENVFNAYDAIRRPRTLRVVDTSRENGQNCMMRGASTGTDLEKLKNDLDTRFEWIWYEDLNAQIDQALKKLRGLTRREETTSVHVSN